MHRTIINLIKIQNQLKNRNQSLNKNPPKIIAVSKTFSEEDIIPLIEHDHIDYGENKIQEALEKWTSLKVRYPQIKLHMLGKVQTNKVKYLLPLFDYIHSLDNLKLAEKIANEEIKKNKKLKIFIQVNIANEQQKNGIHIDELENFYITCSNNFKLNIVGLMCLPPISEDPKKYFLLLQQLSNKLKINDLSMGMSNDYLDATECGSTYLRIGSSIFGSRN
jgi:pyridoxal phosphate enzyme (YggS family)